MVGVGILWTVIYFFYRISFSGILRRFFYTSKDRHEKFTLYDGFRTIIRPGSPAVLMTTFLTICIVTTGIFFAISLTFRERLTIDSTSSVNVYALNILESDEKKVREAFPGKELFSILRGRIIQVNGKSLAEHLGTPKPSREFTREFSITTNSLDTKSIVR